MGGRIANAAAVETAFQGEYDATRKSVIAGGVDQAGLAQGRERITQLHEPAPQATARRVTNAHVLDRFRRAESALLQIGNRLAVAVQVHVVETRHLVQ